MASRSLSQVKVVMRERGVRRGLAMMVFLAMIEVLVFLKRTLVTMRDH